MAKDERQYNSGLATIGFRAADVKELRASMQWPTLRVVAGPDMLSYLVIGEEGSFTVGRDATCDLSLRDASVSRRHLVIERDEEGAIHMEDPGSTNGTTRNGKRVLGRTPLRRGDHVGVGGVMLRMEMFGSDELDHMERVRSQLDRAERDALTGLFNRSFFVHSGVERIDRARRLGTPITGLFVDVDFFKAINDTYGHPVGDEVLRAVARLLLLHLRGGDVCIRYGGEEFLAVLDSCDEMGGWTTAERLRARMARHDWEFYAPELQVTVSVGVAQLREGESIDDWIGRADAAMYAAKRNGRDRVVRASMTSIR